MTSNLETPVTRQIYSDLQDAYDYFNRELFGGKLPDCLIVLSYHRTAYGYFRSKPFIKREQLEEFHEWELANSEGPEESEALQSVRPGIDEISLNIFYFADRTVEQIMSTLVHEMVHLEQFHFGKPPKRPSHNKEWGSMMKLVGLYPSATGEPGGKETGRRVSHYIVDGGPFDVAVKNLPVGMDWVGLLPTRKKKVREPKTTYTCPSCDLKAKAVLDAKIVCGTCEEEMLPPGEKGE